MKQPPHPTHLHSVLLDRCPQPFPRLQFFLPLLNLVEYPRHDFFAGVEHDDCHRFHQITPILTLLLPTLHVPAPPVVVYRFPRMAYRLWGPTPRARRPSFLPPDRSQPTARLVDLLVIFRRRTSAYPPSLPPNGSSVDPAYVATYLPSLEQIHQSFRHAAMFDDGVLLPHVHGVPLPLLLHPYCLGHFSFPCFLFLLL